MLLVVGMVCASHPRTPSVSSRALQQGDVLRVEDAEGLLQRLDLLLALSRSILEAFGAAADARRLQLLVDLHGCVEFLLRAGQVALCFLECLLLAGPFLRLVLDVPL